MNIYSSLSSFKMAARSLIRANVSVTELTETTKWGNQIING